MSSLQMHADNALAGIDELLGLFPSRESLAPDYTSPDGGIFIEKKDARFKRFNELINDVYLDFSRLGFSCDAWPVIEQTATSGTRKSGPGCFLRVEPWKDRLHAVRRAIQRERDSLSEEKQNDLEVVHGVKKSDIVLMRKLLDSKEKGLTAKRILEMKGLARQVSNLVLRTLERLGEFQGYRKKPTKEMGKKIDDIIRGLQIPGSERS
jgi:hypothetical protein